METTSVEELTTTREWATAIPVIQQLWAETNASAIREWKDEPDYHLFGMYADDELVGVKRWGSCKAHLSNCRF